MNAKLIHDGPETTYAVVSDTGDEFHAGLVASAREHGPGGSHLTAIGAFARATLGYSDRQKKEYEKIPINEQAEVLSLTGDIALLDGAPTLHAHAVVRRRDGTAHGGHVLEAYVRPTLKVIVTESPRHLRKRHDPETGRARIAPGAS